MHTLTKRRTMITSKRTFQFSEDGKVWGNPSRLMYIENKTLWPWADNSGVQWKYIKVT